MRKAAILFVCTLAVLLFLGTSMLQSLMIIQRIAAVSDVRGDVAVRRRSEGSFVPLAGARNVMAGDVIRTGRDGFVTLSWVDNHRLLVKPNTTIQVLKCQVNPSRNSQAYLFKLDVGEVWVRVLKALSQESKFEIRTPTATAAVRGTVFSVVVQPNGLTKVAVVRGRVELGSEGGGLSVEQGQAGVVGGKAGPGVLTPLTPEDQAAWREVEFVAKPALTVIEPASDKLPANASTVRVAGVAERGAQVTVNGAPVKTSLKGQFQTTLSLPAGAKEFEIKVRALDSKGFESVVLKRLSR